MEILAGESGMRCGSLTCYDKYNLWRESQMIILLILISVFEMAVRQNSDAAAYGDAAVPCGYTSGKAFVEEPSAEA